MSRRIQRLQESYTFFAARLILVVVVIVVFASALAVRGLTLPFEPGLTKAQKIEQLDGLKKAVWIGGTVIGISVYPILFAPDIVLWVLRRRAATRK